MRVEPISTQMTPEEVSALWLSRYSSSNTRAAYESDVRMFLEWCDRSATSPWDTTSGSLRAYRSTRESNGASSASIARQLAALRGFFNEAQAVGACTANPFEVRQPAVAIASPTRVLTTTEVDELRSAAEHDFRSAVLVSFLVGDGLRLAEALAADHEHLSGSATAMRLRLEARDRRVVALHADTARAVRRLQRESSRVGPLLVAKRGDRVAPARLTRFGADLLIKQAAKAAGITGAVSANVLRRTHAAVAHDAGDEIDKIRHRMGQRDARTTRRYLPPDTTSPTTT